MGRDRSPFGQRMRQARLHAKLKQLHVCKVLGISQGTLSEAETIASGSSHTVRFADLYGVDPTWLTTGEGSMLPTTTPHVDWPFEMLTRAMWSRLTERQRGAVEAAAMRALRELGDSVHSPTPSAPPRPADQPTSRPADQPKARDTLTHITTLAWEEDKAQWDEWSRSMKEAFAKPAPPPRPKKDNDH